MATTQTAQRELVITRTFDAPRELVWKAWTETEHVLQWLGPKGFTALEFTMGAPGEKWHSKIRGPDGTLESGGIVRDVVEPERLAFTFAWSDSPDEETLVEITLTEIDGATEMTFKQATFSSVESRDGHEGGWSESFEKLAEYLAA